LVPSREGVKHGPKGPAKNCSIDCVGVRERERRRGLAISDGTTARTSGVCSPTPTPTQGDQVVLRRT
jgi:hypothetical protein